jgi:hypothetical protein
VLEKGGTFTENDMKEFASLHKDKPAEAPGPDLDEGNLQDFVEHTSSMIHEGKFVDANKNIAMLIQKHHQLHENSPYKKEVYYDILRLKHELKLALLK